nr:sulfotransferase family 2 domain-containing protein [uncultured Rhodopila sp.]
MPTLIHYHIFKNGGSSIDRLLAESFGPGWRVFEGLHAEDAVDADRLRAFLASEPSVRAVSSHLARPPLPRQDCFPIVLLRHPIDRARSIYEHLRRDPSQQDHAAAQSSFADFVTWALDTPGAGVVIRDYQVIHLSDATFRQSDIQLATPTCDDLAQVQTILSSWPAFGLVRQFAASCSLFQARYAPFFPELRLSFVRENVSPNSLATEADAIASARDELGPVLFGRLCEANQLDLALYSFASRLFCELCTANDPKCV